MDIHSYKDFMYRFRKYSFNEAHIVLRRVEPKLLQIVRLLTEVKLEDGSYHTYYGRVKHIITCFLNFYHEVINCIINDADRLKNLANKEDIVELMGKTIEIHTWDQEDFRTEYEPVTPAEWQRCKEIEELFEGFMKKFDELQERVDRVQNSSTALEFAQDQCEKAVAVASGLCEFTYTYLSLILAEDLEKTRISLEEIHKRIVKNLRRMKNESQATLKTLHNQLYNMNKESLTVVRVAERNSADLAEVKEAISSMQGTIENFEPQAFYSRLEEEDKYWQRRLNDFNEVAYNLLKLKAEIERTDKQERIFAQKRTTELPGLKRECWDHISENYPKSKAYLKEKWQKEARALLTFYACRGTDRILYTDNIGKYYVDVEEYDHQVYVFDDGLGVSHLNCNKVFVSLPDQEYFFDKHGRYIYLQGNKVYQLTPCTGLYTLTADNLFSELQDPKEIGVEDVREFGDFQCGGRPRIEDPNDVTILPDFEPKDIKRTLDKETVRYLWNSVCSILPHALCDVGVSNPKNPIHFLAHRLLYYKHTKTQKELHDMKTEAEHFEANILNEREEKAISQSKAWKSKQVKRRKPEESDDMQERAVFDAQMQQQQFINSLNYYE